MVKRSDDRHEAGGKDQSGDDYADSKPPATVSCSTAVCGDGNAAGADVAGANTTIADEKTACKDFEAFAQGRAPACSVIDADDEPMQGLPLVREVLKQRSLAAPSVAKAVAPAPAPAPAGIIEATKNNDDNDDESNDLCVGKMTEIPRLMRNTPNVTLRPVVSFPGAFRIVPFGAIISSHDVEDGVDHDTEYDVESCPTQPLDASIEDTPETVALDAFLVTGKHVEKRSCLSTSSSSASSASSTYEVSQNSSSIARSRISTSLEENIPHAMPYDESDDDEERNPCWKTGLGFAAISLLAVAVGLMALGLGLAGVFSSSTDITDVTVQDNSVAVALPLSTLERIRKEGVLKCGYAPVAGFFVEDEVTGDISGFDASLCYAIGAALKAKVGFVDAKGPTRFEKLANGTYDVLARGVTSTMERNVYLATTQTGFAFSVPYIYTGLKVGGDPFFVTNCADRNFEHINDGCSDLKVCVQSSTTHNAILSDLLPSRKIIPATTLEEFRQAFINGECNVIFQEGHILAEQAMRAAGYTGEYAIGEQLFSKEPLAIVTRNDDVEFSDFVDSILQALFAAEHHNITQASAVEMPLTNIFGDDRYYQAAFRDAIQQGGHYGELYERYLQSESPRNSINMVYTDARADPTGLLYAQPFGPIMEHGRDDTLLGPILQSILDRGVLRCGVRLGRPGLANLDNNHTFLGMDIDYCHALASALFEGRWENVEFIEIDSTEDAAALLASTDIDVAAGSTWDLQTDIREPSTGTGYAFSPPYFYGYSDDEENTSLMTRQDDSTWSAFVYWVVTSTIYAEGNDIHRDSSNEMPEALVFGPALHRMFRDAILTVGSYADIYDRNMEPYKTRRAPNTLNGQPTLGGLHYHVSGFV